jgi:ribosomal protein S18 acetylase RimI-like enzyme
MNISIREATTADAALIADLSRQTFYDTFAAQNTAADMEMFLKEQFTREALMAEVGAPGNTFLLAYTGDKPAGYARLRDTDINDMEIARIYAATDMIGKGIGKALMKACLDLAHAKKKKRVTLGVWEKNMRAIQFYTAWGFEKVAVQDFRLGNDLQQDWVMQKTL